MFGSHYCTQALQPVLFTGLFDSCLCIFDLPHHLLRQNHSIDLRTKMDYFNKLVGKAPSQAPTVADDGMDSSA